MSLPEKFEPKELLTVLAKQPALVKNIVDTIKNDEEIKNALRDIGSKIAEKTNARLEGKDSAITHEDEQIIDLR